MVRIYNNTASPLYISSLGNILIPNNSFITFPKEYVINNEEIVNLIFNNSIYIEDLNTFTIKYYTGITKNDIKKLLQFLNTKETLIWDYNTFINNKNLILPPGIKIFYKRNDGVNTGSFIVTDGINSIENLNFIPTTNLDTFTYSDTFFYEVNNYFFNNPTITGGGYNSNPWLFLYFTFISKPIKLQQVGINCTSLTGSSSNTIYFLLYKVNPVDYSSHYINNSRLPILVTSTGWFFGTYTSPLLVEPGLYSIVIIKPQTAGSSLYLSGNTPPQIVVPGTPINIYVGLSSTTNAFINTFLPPNNPPTTIASTSYVSSLSAKPIVAFKFISIY